MWTWSVAAAVVAGFTQRPLAGFFVAALWLLAARHAPVRRGRLAAAALVLLAVARGHLASGVQADAAGHALAPRGRIALSGRVAGFPRAARYGMTFPFETRVGDRPVRLLVRSARFDIDYGDTLALDAVIVAPRPPTAAYLRAAGLAGVVRAAAPGVRRVARGGEALERRLLWPMHRAARERLARRMGAHAGLPLALALGERGHLDRGTTARFRALGVSHLLALSGLHLGIVVAWTLALGAWLPLRRRWLAAAAAMAVFTGMAGDIPSLRRACIMGLALVTARLTHRPAAPMRALGLALAALLSLEPAAARSAGVQLSFAATFAVLVVAARCAGVFARWRGKRRPARRLAAAAAVTVVTSAAVQAFVLPLQLHHFGALSPAGPLATALLLAPVSAVMGLSLFVAAAGDVPGVGAVAVALLLRAGAATAWLARWAEGVAPPLVPADPPAWAAYYAGLALCWLGWRRPVALAAGVVLVVVSFAR